ncbi:hypothetical protein DFJ74DRAFT_702514 [Hyaloraphidium curvatum]|nr:hypothetical protein DFJ74DRAFT_702514 [Hyaloraphidium curvatum]
MPTDLEVANAYFKCRLANDVNGALALVTDDVVLESSRDGKFSGKEELKKYLEKTPPTGTWDEAATLEDGHPVIKGKVKFMFIPVSVKATFTIRDGKVAHITIGQA